MDGIPNCYRCRFHFFRDQPDYWHEVEWYRVPWDTPYLELENPFYSRVYDIRNMDEETSLGELYEPREYLKGAAPFDLDGSHLCGTPEQWLDGCVAADPRPAVIGGVPVCCGTIPPIIPHYHYIGSGYLRFTGAARSRPAYVFVGGGPLRWTGTSSSKPGYVFVGGGPLRWTGTSPASFVSNPTGPVQSKLTSFGFQFFNTNLTMTFTSAVSAGNLLVAVISSQNGGGVTGTPHDSLNGNWSHAVTCNSPGAGFPSIEIWYWRNTAAGTPTFTFTTGAFTYYTATILELPSSSSVGQLDDFNGTNSSLNTSSTNSKTGTIAASEGAGHQEQVIAASTWLANNLSSMSYTTGYTQQTFHGTAISDSAQAVAYGAFDTSTNCTFTAGGALACVWRQVICNFKV